MLCSDRHALNQLFKLAKKARKKTYDSELSMFSYIGKRT